MKRTSFRRFSGRSELATVLGCCLLVALGLPGSTAAQSAPQLQVDSFRLPNGLKVALSHDPLAPRTTVCVAYHVGSKNERPGLTGFAHFFEHMMFRGTLNVPNFDIPLQPAGGSPNAFTSNDMTVYFETVSNNYVERALYMEAERMGFLSSGLSPEKFDTEREIVKNERRQRMENVPYGLAEEAINASIYPEGHPYSWSVIGSMRDLNNADLGDLREFFYEFYHPGNATLTVVGSFDPQQTRQWIEDYFGALRGGPALVEVTAPNDRVAAARLVQIDQVRFPRVYWTWRAVPETHPDAAPLQVLAGILATGEAARMYQDLVVQTQVASDVSADLDAMELDGTFSTYATVAPGKTVEQVEARLAAVIQDMAENGPSEEEMQRVLVSQQTDTIRSLTSTQNRAFAIGMGLSQYNDPHFYRQQYQQLSEVTAADVQRVTQSYLSADKQVLVVRPASEGESESQAILAGPLQTDRVRPSSGRRQPADEDQWRRLPGPAETSAYLPPEFERFTLSNGMEVWWAKWTTLPLTSVQLIFPVGSAHDPVDKTGLGNLVSRVWDKGTRELDPSEFAAALEQHGTRLAIAQSFDSTSVGFSVTTPELAAAMQLVSEMVQSPRFAAASIELQRNLMLSDLAQGPSMPSWIGSRVFDRLVFGLDHPLGLPGSGFEDSVSQLTPAEVRDHYARNFSPAQAKLIVVGSADREEILPMLEATWGSWENDAMSDRRPSVIRQRRTDRVYAVDKPGAVQSIVMVGKPWRERGDAGTVTLTVGNRIFAGDFLSRMNQNLRETNGYTYGVGSTFAYYQGGSRWRMVTAVRADVTGAALREIMNEIDAARTNRPISAEEVAVARDAVRNSFPERFATPDSIAAELSDLARFDLPNDSLSQFETMLKDVSAEETSRMIAELADPANLTLLVVGDRESLTQQLQEHGFQDVIWLDVNGLPE